MKHALEEQGESSNLHWRLLYRAGALAVLIAVIGFRRNFGAELMAFNGFGIAEVPAVEPVSALEWFDLLRAHPYVGLGLLGFVDLINSTLIGLFFLALYGALRKVDHSLGLIAASASLLGVGLFLGTNQSINLYLLSEQFAAANSPAQQLPLLAAGEALLTINHGMGFHLSLLLMLLGGLLFSVVMLHSTTFSKTTAIVGLLANALGLGQIAALFLPETISWILPTLAAPLRMAWYLLTASQLLRLSRAEKPAQAAS